MDKTITARFDSVDMATFAAKTARSHFPEIKGIRINSQRMDGKQEEGWNGKPEVFADFFVPATVQQGQPGATSAAAFPIMGPAIFVEQNGNDYELDVKKVKAHITCDEKVGDALAAAIRTCGGWDVQIS